MKTLLKLFSALIACLMLTGCDTGKLLAHVDIEPKYAFPVFKFSDPEYQYHIIARLDTISPDGPKIILPSAFPRRDLHEEYYYYENKYLHMDYRHGWSYCDTAAIRPEIDKTSLCDLSSGPGLLELADGYYTWYPFTSISVGGTTAFLWWEKGGQLQTLMDPVVLSARWEDICSFDMDTVQIISTHPYSDARGLSHMYKYTRNMSTEELIETVNRLIKENDFAHGGREPHRWFK